MKNKEIKVTVEYSRSKEEISRVFTEAILKIYERQQIEKYSRSLKAKGNE